jgi:hypothetical protein
MLSQLLRADEQLYQIIWDIYVQSGRPIAESYTEIEAALAVALAKTRFPQTFIVIDALDECQDVPKLLASIHKCMRSAQSTIRVLITSRPMIPSIVIDYDVHIDDVQGTAAFIKAYISHRVNTNPNLRGTDLGNNVISKVSAAANGLWLYARLMMDEITRLASSALIERQLRTIPRGLTQVYSQIIRSSEQHFSDEEIKFAQQIFLWLDIADYMPAFLATGYEGLPLKTLSLVLQYVNFGQPVFNPIALAKELCSPLVEVRELSPSRLRPFQSSLKDRSLGRPRDFELDYVHHTAEQYILESFASPLLDLPLVLRPRRFRYFHRAAVAMWYFSECAESEEYLHALRRKPNVTHMNSSYFDMAYGIWGALKLSELEVKLYPEEISELTSLVRDLSTFITSNKCLKWVEMAIIINYSAEYYHLLLNATEALNATLKTNTNGMTVWEEFQKARIHFLFNFVYILNRTGPPLPESFRTNTPTKPTGFDDDSLARAILNIGNTWEQEWVDWQGWDE